jgi:hypothetical protein
MGESRVLYRFLVGKTGRKRPLGKIGSRCEDNIKMDLQEVGWVPWTGSSSHRVGTVGGHL